MAKEGEGRVVRKIKKPSKKKSRRHAVLCEAMFEGSTLFSAKQSNAHGSASSSSQRYQFSVEPEDKRS